MLHKKASLFHSFTMEKEDENLTAKKQKKDELVNILDYLIHLFHKFVPH